MSDEEKTGKAPAQSPESRKPREHRLRERWLSERLRRLYDETVEEPIPEELQNLLSRLDDSEEAGDADKKSRDE